MEHFDKRPIEFEGEIDIITQELDEALDSENCWYDIQIINAELKILIIPYTGNNSLTPEKMKRIVVMVKNLLNLNSSLNMTAETIETKTDMYIRLQPKTPVVK